MRRTTTAAIGIGALSAAVWGVTRVLRSGQHVHLKVDQPTSLPADVVIGRVADIRSEPAMIPFVESVEVIKESVQSAEYIVRGRTLGIPWWMHYAKQWDYGRNTVSWRSLDGSYGIQNTGWLSVVGHRDDNTIKLATGYSVNVPVGAGYIERIIKPFLAYAFGVWLKRLSR